MKEVHGVIVVYPGVVLFQTRMVILGTSSSPSPLSTHAPVLSQLVGTGIVTILSSVPGSVHAAYCRRMCALEHRSERGCEFLQNRV